MRAKCFYRASAQGLAGPAVYGGLSARGKKTRPDMGAPPVIGYGAPKRYGRALAVGSSLIQWPGAVVFLPRSNRQASRGGGVLIATEARVTHRRAYGRRRPAWRVSAGAASTGGSIFVHRNGGDAV